MIAVLAVTPLVLPLWAAAGDSAQPGVTTGELVGYLHLLLFVFWLGADAGVFICARGTVQPGLSAEQRLRTARLMSSIELAPRVSASLMLTVGGLLTEHVGVEHPPWQMAGIILLGPVWLTLVLISYYRDGTPFGALAGRLDAGMRALLVAAVPISVAYAWSTGRLAAAPYVAWKLLIFAVLMALGLLMRRTLKPFTEGLHALAAQGSTPEVENAMALAVGRSRPYVLAMWAALAAAAFLGISKPGAPEQPRESRPTAAADQPAGAMRVSGVEVNCPAPKLSHA